MFSFIAYLLNESKNYIDKPYLFFVGNRHKYKNVKFMMKAITLNAGIMKNYNIIFFGGGNNALPYSVNDRVLFSPLLSIAVTLYAKDFPAVILSL